MKNQNSEITKSTADIGGSTTPGSPASPTNPSIQQSINPVDRSPDAATRSPHENHRNKGKIARFPKEIRDQLNEMIEDGLPYQDIIQQLGDWGKDLNQRNISTWKNGPHQEWLQEQKRVASCRSSQELAIDLVRERDGIDSFQAPTKVAAAMICETLTDIGAGTMRKAFETNPLNLIRTLNSLARLTSGGLKCERHLIDEVDRKTRIEKQNMPPKEAGLSEERRQYIEKRFNLFPPSAYRRRRTAKRRRKPAEPQSPLDSNSQQ